MIDFVDSHQTRCKLKLFHVSDTNCNVEVKVLTILFRKEMTMNCAFFVLSLI